jgi:hypothetical protein
MCMAPGARVAFVADKFPSDFYVTCATVIPVLFLALAVQGPVYEWVLRTSERAERYSNTTWRRGLGRQPPARRERPLQGTREMVAEFASVVLWVIALLIVFAGGFGEGLALYALYRGSEPADARRWVLVATLVLVAAVVAGPLLAGARSLWLSIADAGSLLRAGARQGRADRGRAVEAQGGESPKDGNGQAPGHTAEDGEP